MFLTWICPGYAAAFFLSRLYFRILLEIFLEPYTENSARTDLFRCVFSHSVFCHVPTWEEKTSQVPPVHRLPRSPPPAGNEVEDPAEGADGW